GQTPTSQLGGTESRGPHPDAVGPSAVQCSNVPPDRLVSAPRPIQLSGISVHPPANADTMHPIEGFSELIRSRTAFNTHSSELLVTTIQDINGNIRFEHRSGWYRTSWIGGRFRIVVSKVMAEKVAAVSETFFRDFESFCKPGPPRLYSCGWLWRYYPCHRTHGDSLERASVSARAGKKLLFPA
ncbi:hypothetical protein C8A00DRAFT_18949, partial [Chaetomidium leptoderma]